jgi:hypothetical protein
VKHRLSILAVAFVATACDRTSRAPTPTGYQWPETLSYRLDYVSQAQREREPIFRYTETKTLRLERRDDRYLGGQDSVLKTGARPNEPPHLVSYTPEDTLTFYVKLGRRGELDDVRLGCDPALPECAQALPSAILLELRRVIPRLSTWEAPANSGWQDTVAFDDASRPGGTRGSMITSYTGRRDTTIGGHEYWLVGWRSVRQAFRAGAGAAGMASETPVSEDGVTLVDKRRLIPVLSMWAGAAAAPPAMQSMGATASGFRGRAYLVNSPFDSLYTGPPRP